MTGDLQIHIGDTAEDFGARFIKAFHRAERGDTVSERHLSFDCFATLAKVLTPRRMEMLRYLHQTPVPSVNVLAKALKRDYRRVHADVQALADAGLVDRDEAGFSAPYDVISTRIAL